ncbi:unnamed protein product [Oikopleura dioica]|nr:unnamed protein product [Oikopleura dioica]
MGSKRRGDQTSQQVSGRARKIARKEERKSKKQRRANFQKTKNSEILNSENEVPKPQQFAPPKPMTITVSEPEELEKEKKELTTIEKEMKIVKREKKKHRKKMVKSREMTIDDLQAGIDDDDAIIRNMERKLGIKKKKKKELTTSDEIRDSLKIFGDEAIDLESGKPEDLKKDENLDTESLNEEEGFEEGDFSEDEEMFSGEEDDLISGDDDEEIETKETEEVGVNVEEDFTAEELAAFDQHHDEDSEDDDAGSFSGEDEESEDNEEDEAHSELKGLGDEPSDSDEETDDENTEISEAIFGADDSDDLEAEDLPQKHVQKQEGALPQPEVKKYVPPALRAQNNALERLVRGHLNKLSSSNLYAIVQEFQSVFRNNARREVSSIITKTIFNQVIQSSQTPHLLVEDYSSFLMSIHFIVSEEITGFFVEDLINKFFELNEENDAIDVLKMKNLLALVCTLTRLKLFNVKLVLEIVKEFTKRFSSSDIEFIQLILLQAAFSIRKEAPAELKSIIIDVHAKVNEKSSELESVGGSRAKFMLEMLLNVKNNNLNAMKAHPGFIENERDQNCKKRIRAVVGQVQIEPFAAVGLSDILDIPKRGRWWRVGASVTVIR